MVAHLSQAVGETGTVLAIDAQDAMIEYLSSRIEALGPATIKPQKVRPDDPHLQNDSVDAILLLDTWHHIGGQLCGRERLAKASLTEWAKGRNSVPSNFDWRASSSGLTRVASGSGRS